jgi:hypothetical protein
MREANYARRNAAKSKPDAATPTPAESASTVSDAPKAQATKPRAIKTPTTGAKETLCGHRNMGGKTCSRPAGHAEKNHRYK